MQSLYFEKIDMRKNEIEKYVKLLGRIEAAKSKLPTLKIDWETDIEKIDFSKLYSFQSVKDINLTIIRIEMIPVERMDDNLFYGEDAERMLNLIEFVDNGKKIIPPLSCIDYTIKDGEKIICSDMHPADGLHRRKLASAIGLLKYPPL